MDPNNLRFRLQAKMSRAQTPYDSVSGGVYLQRAWERGAAYAIEQCMEIVASELPHPANEKSRSVDHPKAATRKRRSHQNRAQKWWQVWR